MLPETSPVIIWAVAATATAGVILRPFGWPEAIWAVAGALLLLALRLLSPGEALASMARGGDVMLFLTGMMLLAETARAAGLFDWLAAIAARQARGSARLLFLLIYAVGTLVTVLLSNDATAIVLTPAVAAAVRTARAQDPLPYLLICAFVANAASFVLPISNPANLVIYSAHLPPLQQWLPRFGLPSLCAILVTYLMLRWTQRTRLRGAVARDVPVPTLSSVGRVATGGILMTALMLLCASWFDLRLGAPTAGAGAMTTLAVLVAQRQSPWTIAKNMSWGVLPLVAGLFVLVGALEQTGLIRMLSRFLHSASERVPGLSMGGAGLIVALATNLMNNLPAGLIAGHALQGAPLPGRMTRAVLIGIDLGPNLSVTGSLATLLWLIALRREGIRVSAWQFLKLGTLVMPPALLLALGAVGVVS